MKNKLFTKEPTWDVVWSDATVKRRRSVCKVSSMLKALALCTKPEAALLASKISKLTAIEVSRRDIESYANSPDIVTTDNVDTSEMALASSPATVASRVDCPLYPIQNVQGLLVGCNFALGEEEAKKVVLAVVNMQASEALERNVHLRKQREQELAYQDRKYKREEEEEEAKIKEARQERDKKRKRSDKEHRLKSLLGTVSDLKKMGFDEEADTVLKEYMAARLEK